MDENSKSGALDEHKRLATVVKSIHAGLRKKLRESKRSHFNDLYTFVTVMGRVYTY